MKFDLGFLFCFPNKLRRSGEKTSNPPGGCFPKPGSLEHAVCPQAAQLLGEIAGGCIKYCNLRLR